MWPVFASLIVINLPVVDIRILWFRKRFGCCSICGSLVCGRAAAVCAVASNNDMGDLEMELNFDAGGGGGMQREKSQK